MALINSLTSGVSALKSFTRGMEVIGDNIANVNTTAFKAARINYADSFSNMLRNSSSSNGNSSNVTASQVGTGVKVQTVSANWGQGFIDNTGLETDLAIAGDGFFRVIDPVNNTEYATRAGNFRVDDRGNITTVDGFRVQGLMGGDIQYDVFLDSRNNLVYSIRDGFPQGTDPDTVADLNVQPPALNTTTGSLAISSAAPTGLTAIPLNQLGQPYKLADLEDQLATANGGDGLRLGAAFTTIDEIEDLINVGTITLEQINAALAAEGGGSGLDIGGTDYTSLTTIRAAINSGVIASEATADAAIAGANGGAGLQAIFNRLSEIRGGISSGFVAEAEVNTALGAQFTTEINFQVDDGTGAYAAVDFDGTAGADWALLDSLFKINPVNNDTYSLEDINNKAPRVESFSFDVQGNLNITMSDGNSFTQGKLLLMRFNDPQALVKEGAGLYTGFDAAGVVGNFLTNYPGENGVGKVLQRSLEQSNVDLTGEFANMITAQRSFQAGSRVVTVSDDILDEVVNLKR